MASADRSVAKICRLYLDGGLMPATTSWKTMASEYASSPVEHAGTQALKARPSGCAASNCGKATIFRYSHTLGSRKKLVTPISNSLNSKSISAGLARKYGTYSSIDVI